MGNNYAITEVPMQLDYAEKKFVLLCSYAEREYARKAGFTWDSVSKQWVTTHLAVAQRLRDYATPTAERVFQRRSIVVSPYDAALPLPPKGLTLYPHQETAIRFALTRNRSYLGLDPGLGKTACAAMITKALDTTAVYITPPFLQANVLEEFERWGVGRRVTIVRDSMLNKEDTMRKIIANASGFRHDRPTTLFVDEAHRFKNADAIRTRKLFGHKKDKGIIDHFDRVVFMSGTPMPNRPSELYTLLSKAAPETIGFMNWWQYAKRYCNAHQTEFGIDTSGFSNLAELRSNVIHPSGPFMLRMRKTDVLDLPPKLEEIFVLSEKLSPAIAKIDGSLRKTLGDTDADEWATKLAKAHQGGGELHTSTYQRLLGIEKAKPAATFVDSILDETDENVIVFARHVEVVTVLTNALAKYKPIVITGSVAANARQALVKEFQTSTKRRLIIGNYDAMGVGFTLTKATRVVFVEFSWVPGVNDQAADRTHRIGQNQSVLVQYVVFHNSIDKAIMESLLRKRKAIAYV